MGNSNQKYINFFAKIKKFRIKQTKQKQRGLNDFNPLIILRKYHDEVHLHSAMIGELLNPDSKHYQDSLFLECFLDEIKINFPIDLSNVQVYTEYKDIDLYITDGINHIIIENKVYAKDVDCQIIKYINIIKNENDLTIDNSTVPPIVNNLYVLYLTPNKKESSFEHKVENGFISFDGSNEKLNKCSQKENTKNLVPNGLENYCVQYKNITYDCEIKNWLKKSLEEVRNIINLSEIIKQYIEVVEIVNKTYKGKVMSLEEYIQEHRDDEDMFAILEDLVKNHIDKKDEIKKNLFENILVEQLKVKLKSIDAYNDYIVCTNNGNFMKKHDGKIEIFKENWKIRFIIRFDKDNMQCCYWSFAKIDDSINFSAIREEFKKLNNIKKGNKTDTSLIWKYFVEYKDLDKKVIELQFKPEKFASHIFDVFQKTESEFKEKYEASFDDINSYLLEQ